jgi:hypothetical protein
MHSQQYKENNDKAKPVVRQGRKATDLIKIAGLPIKEDVFWWHTEGVFLGVLYANNQRSHK